MTASSPSPSHGPGEAHADLPRSRAFAVVSRWLGAAAAAIGIIALVGWATGIGVLKSVLPEHVEMKPNTAVGIILLGLALALPTEGRAWARRAGITLALLAVALGLGTLLQDATGVDFGIDQALFHEAPSALGTATPGRMAASSAMCLVLLGLSLVFLRSHGFMAVAQGLTVVAGAFALLELLAFILGVRGASPSDPFTLMALNAAVAFSLLVSGTLLASAAHGGMRVVTAGESGGHSMRRVVPAISVALLVAAVATHVGENRGFYSHDFSLAVFATLGILSVTAVAWVVSRRLNEREVEQRTEHAQLQALLDSTPDGIMTVDERDEIRSANHKAEQMLGYPPGRLAGLAIGDLVPAGPRSPLSSYLAAFGTGQRRSSTTIELELVREDGSGLPAELGLAKLELADEDLTIVIIRDIGSRREAEMALRQSEERFRTLANQIPGVASIEIEDPESPYKFETEFISPQIFDLIGWTPEEWIADPELWIRVVHPDDRARCLEAASEAYATKQPYRVEYRMITRAGDTRWVSEVSVKRGSPDDPRWHGVMTDITDKKSMEQVVREKDAAVRANEMKDEFLSRMSHELRTPLNAIMGFAQLLELEDLDELGNESVGHILKAGRHLVALVDDVLGITSLEGAPQAPLESVELEPLIHGTVDMLRSEADGRRIGIEVQADGGGLSALADRMALQRALRNLVSNAIRYNREGGSVYITIGESSEDRVRIDIRDTGEGIPEDQIPLLFAPFERLGATSGSVEGTGLGLTICRALLGSMDGSVSVTSVHGQGATFSVELPSASG